MLTSQSLPGIYALEVSDVRVERRSQIIADGKRLRSVTMNFDSH